MCGLSGGADSTALVALAVASGCDVTAVHVHHGLRPNADDDAAIAGANAATLGVEFRVEHVELPAGANLEARARTARHAALAEPGRTVMTGHTADDQAETVLLALLRGAGAAGLSAMTAGARHPILALRRTETEAVCAHLGLGVAHDDSNDDLRFRRNRIRHELVPLLDDIGSRDVVPLLNRTAELLRGDDAVLDALAAEVDPTSAREIAGAPVALARRSIRRWLTVDGYPPDLATVDRVLDVALGHAASCDADRGRRVVRSRQELQLLPATPAPPAR